MKNKVLFLAVFILSGATTLKAQLNVGSTSAPNADAMLQVSGTTKGLLLPKVALTATTAAAPLSAHVSGMTVYNTATAGDVTPGYYYDNGTVWVRLASATTGTAWQTTGNAGTTAPTATGTAATNFWGTTDAKSTAVGTNGITRAIFDTSGSLYGGSGTYDATIHPVNSLVWGTSNIDSSMNSLVFGSNNNLGAGTGGNVQRNGGVILGGANNTVSGISYGSTIGGNQNILTGQSFENTVGGFQNTLNGSQKMIVAGQGNISNGAVMGYMNGFFNTLAGGYAMIQGSGNNVASDNGYALGNNNIINTGSAVGFTLGASDTIAASNANAMVIGSNGKSTAANQFTSNFSGGHNFYVASNTSGTPAMTITPSGNVGIGIASPGDKLIVGSSTVAAPFASGVMNAQGYGRMAIANLAGDYGATQPGDLVLNQTTTGKGIALTTPGLTNMYLASTGTVGIGTTAPNASAALDITSTTKGFLPPRVALTATNAASPLSAMVAGMVVYNTATTTGGTNNVAPGLYLNDGTLWKQVQTSSASVAFSKVATAAAQVVADVSAASSPFTSHAIVAQGTVNAYCASGSIIFTLYIQQSSIQGFTLNGSGTTGTGAFTTVGGNGGATLSADRKTLTIGDGCGDQTTTLNINSSGQLTVASTGNGYGGQQANLTVTTL